MMEPSGMKSTSLKNIFVRILLIGVFFVLLRFVFVVTINGKYYDASDFYFFSFPENLNLATTGPRIRAAAVSIASDRSFSSPPALRDLWTSREWRKKVDFYSSVFQDLIVDGYISPNSKALCVETLTGQDVFSLKEIGVSDAIGISKKASPPLVRFGQAFRQPFDDDTFDFVFSGVGGLDQSVFPFEFASEIGRIVKPEGFVVIHTASKDLYSFNSFLDLFHCCRFVRSHEIEFPDSSITSVREIVLRREQKILGYGEEENPDGSSVNKCSVPGHKHELVRKIEPLIAEEPLKPWLTLKRNIKNVKYLPSMADISFKRKYVYIDVGARSFGSSIGSWFRKQYPKQNKTFEIYAIEADKSFHEEYRTKKGVNLLPYAAWVRNETLFFEINRAPVQKIENKGRGMGRIQPVVQSSTNFVGDVDKIRGFDFANWLKNTVSQRDYVVMKMDVEGTEFDLIPRLFDTGAICLIDEIFLECHYNRWQKCCPGERSSKYRKTYDQCLELFSSLRETGILVHQWW